MNRTEERYLPKVGVVRMIVKSKPAHCVDCEFLALRKEPDVYPTCCGITDTDITDTEGTLPEDCPLEEYKPRYYWQQESKRCFALTDCTDRAIVALTRHEAEDELQDEWEATNKALNFCISIDGALSAEDAKKECVKQLIEHCEYKAKYFKEVAEEFKDFQKGR